MPPPTKVLSALLDQLRKKAEPRPDLITPGSTGSLENARPVTFAGRMVMPGETAEQALSRFPQGETESGGQALQQISDLAIKAAIPTVYWKRPGLRPEAKAGLSIAFNDQPELMKRALESKTKFFPDYESPLHAAGSSEPLGSGIHAVRIAPPLPPNVYKLMGRTPPHVETELSKTGTHELTHALQHGRVMMADPNDAGTIGMMLNDLIRQEAPFLNRSSLESAIVEMNDLQDLINTTPRHKLREGIVPLKITAKTRYGGIEGPEMSTIDAYKRLSMDEGLATLAESAAEPGARPLLQILAERLGLGVVPIGQKK